MLDHKPFHKTISRRVALTTSACCATVLVLNFLHRGIGTIFGSDLSRTKLEHIGRQMTVKISSQYSQGSGFIYRNEGNKYIVITSAHIIIPDIKIYKIQTNDGITHAAKLISHRINSYDLKLLEFNSQSKYYSARLKDSSIQTGDLTYSIGFSSTFAEEKRADNYLVTSGRIDSILEKPLHMGYQIGVTNDLHKGMSGGPLVNSQGHVVGVNGIQKNPLWGDPYVFLDGSEPDLAAQKTMKKLSWAVPAEYIDRLF